MLPFFEFTAPRYDTHFEGDMTITAAEGVNKACDCTHFCYSPPFWQEVHHNWYHTLATRVDQLEASHAQDTASLFSRMFT
jgi:hypothetical protein